MPSPPAAFGAHPEARASERDVDALHYALDLQLHPEERRLTGTARVTFSARRALTELRLDLVGLTATSARAEDGRALAFRHSEGELVVTLPSALAPGASATVEIDYGGTPRRGLYFIGGVVDHCFTQGECEDARRWFPCLDHPADRATSELTVEMPFGWSSVSGGERFDVVERGDRRIERWRMDVPHPTYLTTLVAGELTRVESVAENLGLTYVAPRWRAPNTTGKPTPADADSLGPLLEASLGATPEVLAFLEEWTGRPYPYSKYATACVDDFPFGGMENASATTVSVTALRSADGRRDGDAEGLVAHEAAHQWFGDLLTCAEWPEIWLNEGFATYCALLWHEQRRGREDFELALRDSTERYLAGDERTPRALVHGLYVQPMDLFFTGHAYQGGASRLHLLREQLGDDAFRAGLRRYVGEHQHTAVTTADLQRSFEAATGVALDGFFADWVHGPGHPVFDVSWRYDASRARVLVRVDQVQALESGAAGAFRGRAELSLSIAGEHVLHRVEVVDRRHLFEVPCAVEPEWVVFDPRGVWPARVRHIRGGEELTQVAHAHPSPVARREAVRALAARRAADVAFAGPVARALVQVLREDTHVAVRVAAAELLRAPFGEEAENVASALRNVATADGPPALRRVAFESLALFVARQVALAGAHEGAARTTRPSAANALPVTAATGRDARDLESGAAVDLAVLREAAGAALGDPALSWAVRGGAAQLMVACDPVAGLEALASGIERARPSVDDPHGGLAVELVSGLRPALAIGTVAVRNEAAALAARIALDRSTPPLVREAATGVLGAVAARVPSAEAALVELLGDRRARLRTAAVQALIEAGHEGAKSHLATYAQRTLDPRERDLIRRFSGR